MQVDMVFSPFPRSKLQCPRVVADFVVREDLQRQLEDATRLPLTVVAAPLGYGKTSLVAHWLADRVGLAAWLSLDAADGEPYAFIHALVAAVRSVLPDACSGTLACFAAQCLPPLAILVAQLGNELGDLAEPLVLVLDDLHCVHDRATYGLLDRLLLRPPPHLHLVLIGRSDPPLSLGALRVRGALHEIGVRDLQFNRQQAAQIIEHAAAGELGNAAVTRLYERSGGWPAGVRLAALLQRHRCSGADPAASLAGGTPMVGQYFVDQILSPQPEAVRTALLRTALLDCFCAALCDALAGEDAGGDPPSGTAFLDHVRSGSVLASPVDAAGEWYRYHPLLREFLQARLLTQVGAAEMQQLHRRAAAWFAAHDRLEDAIRHQLAGAGAAAAGQLLVHHRDTLLQHGQQSRLASCLQLLPADAVETDAELLSLKAWLLYRQGRLVETAAVLDRMQALLEPSAVPSQVAAPVHGSLLALRSMQEYLEGNGDEAASCAGDALACLPAERIDERVLAQTVIAGARQLAGDLSGARQGIDEALAQAPGPIARCQVPLLAARCCIDWMAADLSALHLVVKTDRRVGGAPWGSDDGGLRAYFLGLVQYQRNELALAEQTLLSASTTAVVGYRAELSLLLAAVCQALGQADRANAIIDAVCQHLQQQDDLHALYRAYAFRAELALRQGQLAIASDWANGFDPGPLHFAYHLANVSHLTLAKVWIAEGSNESREQAARLLQLLERELAARHNIRFLVEVLALQSLLQHGAGDDAAAADLLGRAVALAQPGGFVRLFVDLGQDLLPPLRRLKLDRSDSRYLQQILVAFNDDWLACSGRQEPRADLTRRELKILKLLAVRLSNVEISEELCISRATVKRHTQNIYRKLRASSRREAVVRARTLNILLDA
ncbi:LuxR C-terminal-related transcriptional regulator [Accumulibacter sp.]|uniref:LuxR C-terminal-related transcriptional regulator n=1 Tax=Accumulibacter sp. TaxID=2053492 RepID=UPI0025DD929F|nr:LuxR C-terminal-related transcriptional regulator [Accumulibacter sp.]MCM8612223.1 LuxR C-terminal-related transcriptional regulator [Accumulibacter sp.]MCM8635896.1 LuxR C-terminal-related transcriptional regulator [Accumulibacter sp.]MCM8639495.1 LuxR C-terminal-related transcriptional regulator [Accumulibacter sp.]